MIFNVIRKILNRFLVQNLSQFWKFQTLHSEILSSWSRKNRKLIYLKHWQTITSITTERKIYYFSPANAIKAVWIIDQWFGKLIIRKNILGNNPLQPLINDSNCFYGIGRGKVMNFAHGCYGHDSLSVL